LIERRADPHDRRAKRLYLTPAARPLLERIADQIEELSETILAGIKPAEIDLMLGKLGQARDNLRQAIEQNGASEAVKRYG
jgi:MarR family transcriptional regulator, transcriptional regulator for hemolysin